jgi:small-conductance mechanosensitive channel
MREWARPIACGMAAAVMVCASLLAQAPAASTPQTLAIAPAAITVAPAAEFSTLTFFNRPIVVLRAHILGRTPSDRTLGAERILSDMSAQGTTGPVSSRPFDGGVVITVDSRAVLALTSADIDDLAGETFDGVTSQTIANLSRALSEAAEAHAPAVLVRALALALLALALTVGALWLLSRVHRRLATTMADVAERQVTKAGLAPLSTLRASRLLDVQRHVLTALIGTLDLVVTYVGVTFILKRFPYTRAWGESMSGFLLSTVTQLGVGVIDGLPGLFTVFIIFSVARFLTRLIRLWFEAVEREQVKARWIYPDTAQPTRRLATVLLWLFAVVVAYPYMPGSETEAFKGVSVFLGLMVTFGSSGLVNQIMSGFMITYSRALRIGDFVRIGAVEGTVTYVGVLATSIRTLMNEEITVPNAVLVSQTTTDFSRASDNGDVYTPTSVTIGYDTPWRQVQALLLTAAARTPGLAGEPKGQVFQTALEDFYVRYTLWVRLEHQEARMITLNALHANIQDLFNEHGVQIMSPNYMVDPAAPKIVPKKDWYPSPTREAPSNVA